MNKALGDFIYRTVLKFGFEIRRKQEIDRFKWLKALGIDTILDIGANEGQFADFLRNTFPDAMIYAFEPLPDCFDTLNARYRSDRRFKAFNLAVSDVSGVVEFHRSPFSQSSSMLPSARFHNENFPFAAGETLITVNSTPLDAIADTLEIGSRLLIKIDVQGVEEKVFAGGRKTISRADVVLLETNFQQLYEGQLFFKGAVDLMYDMGFVYLGNVASQLLSPINGTCIEEDSIFVNRRLFDPQGNYVGVSAAKS